MHDVPYEQTVGGEVWSTVAVAELLAGAYTRPLLSST